MRTPSRLQHLSLTIPQLLLVIWIQETAKSTSMPNHLISKKSEMVKLLMAPGKKKANKKQPLIIPTIMVALEISIMATRMIPEPMQT